MDRSASTSAQKCDRAIIAGELISPIQNPGNELICAPNNGARKQIYEEYEAYVDSLGNAYNCFTAECRRIILRIVTRRAESRNARAFTCPESRLINAARTRNSCVLSRNVTPVTAREIRKRSRDLPFPLPPPSFLPLRVLAGRIPDVCFRIIPRDTAIASQDLGKFILKHIVDLLSCTRGIVRTM